jgi:hypothetical protein
MVKRSLGLYGTQQSGFWGRFSELFYGKTLCDGKQSPGFAGNFDGSHFYGPRDIE